MSNLCGNCFRESLNDQGVCTACGFDGWKNKEKYPLALPAGSILNGRYIIGKVLGQGGFGITYMARDHQTGTFVAIKEFFPESMVTRNGQTTVTPYTGERGENFAYGKDTFLLEARTMAQFIGNPNIVRVNSYFEENGTAYFVMEYVDGQSFQAYLKGNFGRIPWEDAMRILLPVMDALAVVHEKGIIHRDIAPDNICIAKDGTVKLLDFGAARYSLGNVSQSLDVVLRHGFAPKEQYKRRGRQGPYTDVYALGATLYYALTGVRPDDALERQDEDNMPLPSSLGANVTEAQEEVILKAMAVQPEDRYQSMAEFKAELLASAHVKKEAPRKKEAPKKESVKQASVKPKQESTKKEKPPKKGLLRWITPAIAAFLLVMGIMTHVTENADKSSVREETSSKSVSAQQTQPKQQKPAQSDADLVVGDPNAESALMASFPEEPDVSYSELGNTPFWGQKTYDRNDVLTMRFQNTLAGVPADAWDVSAAGDGSIMAWMQEGNLTVAANGNIALPSDATNLFFHFEEMTALDFGGCVDTSRVTIMDSMFQGCRGLTELDVSFFDTGNVTSTNEMFYGCHNLLALDVSGFNTSNMENMRYMFYSCSKVKYLDLSSFDTSSATDMSNIFGSCSDLKTLDLSGFDTSRVTDMSSMFWGCHDLTTLDLSSFNTINVSNMDRMFLSCDNLTSLDLSHFNTANVKKMGHMFDNCKKLTNLNVSGWNTSSVEDLANMFDECSSLVSLDLSSFRTSNVKNMGCMFLKCSALTNLDISNFDSSSVEPESKKPESSRKLADQMELGYSMKDMFKGCSSLKKPQCSDKAILSEYKNR